MSCMSASAPAARAAIEGVHGTARFAGFGDLKASGLLPMGERAGRGVYCGGYDDPKAGRVHYLRHDGPEHICAPLRHRAPARVLVW